MRNTNDHALGSPVAPAPLGTARTQARKPASSDMLPEATFTRMVEAERKRTERSRRGVILMLLECGAIATKSKRDPVLERLQSTLPAATRETDIKGWYEDGLSLGILFTEIAPSEGLANAKTLMGKIRKELSTALTSEELQSIRVSYRIFPEDKRIEDLQGAKSEADAPQVEVTRQAGPTGLPRLVKRSIDIGGSALALLVGAPFLLAIAIAIKMTSKGPVLFRQTRHGQHGKPFTFLKFRSMVASNDPKIHQEYVKKLITGQKNGKGSGDGQVFKITNDPRVTRIGAWLRRTSMDELPQFINVLKGDMSLVGPRPPVTYELEHYDAWHHRRLDVVPGLTGLWQVEGRSRTTFDEMVRMDLEYARTWSLWLDLKILLRTPVVVLMGDGAY